MKIENRGGARVNAGRKALFGDEDVKRISVTIPASREGEIKIEFSKVLKKYKKS